MTEREVLLAAFAVVVAAAAAVSVPWWMVLACLVTAGARRPVLVVVPLVLVSSTLAARAEAGLVVAPHSVEGVARVVSDPEQQPGGVVVELAVDGHRFRAFVGNELAPTVGEASVGEELVVSGRVGPLSGPWGWRASRHLAGRLSLTSVSAVSDGAWWWRSANWMHRTVEGGLGSFDADERALFLGVVFGDDRGQSDLEQFRFRSAGLSHLLAVSGQNVAFMLVAASPVLRRLRLRGRWAATLAALCWFALVTRLEPSVLRAVAMAMVAATASFSGRYVTGLRVLSVAVIGVVLVDPLIVWSLGFRLSVSASLALVTLARPLSRCLPGPRVVAEAVAVSLAAQVGTAPLLLSMSGTVPALGPVANLMAVPVAGWLMVWGVVSGPVAGLVGEPVATVLGWPSRLMLRWLTWVAHGFADPGLPRLGLVGVAGSSVAVLVLVAHHTRNVSRADRRNARVATRFGGWVVATVGVVGLTCAAADGAGFVGPQRTAAARGAAVWSEADAAIMSLGAGASDESALGLLSRCRCSRLDVVIVTGGGRSAASAVWALRQIVDVGVVLAIDPATVRDAQQLTPGTIAAGSVRVRVVANEGRAGVRVSSSGDDRRPRDRADPSP